ncbi:putative lytic murein transglycosylase [Candidatus Terasakiella magnetica]|uniref:peptidoglycan lytic exotransglycosylase n=1 Tax=Candidatus Terasakiella magnetica TaxID=1867952 RepID=A0A1C3RGL4_9PROT|nr:murein transglycosylase A [Candidatus Terasakiella magnetica]SCA56332.1 putative lytic murein transglycosylase [Candidatus Terasakiella magnetica]
MKIRGQSWVKRLSAIGVLGLMTACAQPQVDSHQGMIAPKDPSVGFNPKLLPVSFAALPGWEDDNIAESLPALRRSCEKFARMKESKLIGPKGIGGAAGDWKPICTEAYSLPDGDSVKARAFYESFFQPYLISDLKKDKAAGGLFTGYYEAGLRGAKSKGGIYQTPLYKRPKDLVLVGLGEFKRDWRGKRLAGKLENGQLVPYATRAEIEAGKLRGKNLELVWVDDPVDAFFLHIQGSGRVLFADGTTMRVGYDGHNGHDYTSIGRILIERGEVSKENMSMQAIRKWMAAHPKKGQDLMKENGSFIFFRELKDDGPIGAQGVVLTPGRSLAVDKRFLPLGLPLYLHTFTDPLSPSPISRLVVAQDTGGAIKGVVRGDVFWGFGELAANRAGKMKEGGSFFALLPSNSLSRCQICEAAEDSPVMAQ